jgi:hypothetical protein
MAAFMIPGKNAHVDDDGGIVGRFTPLSMTCDAIVKHFLYCDFAFNLSPQKISFSEPDFRENPAAPCLHYLFI